MAERLGLDFAGSCGPTNPIATLELQLDACGRRGVVSASMAADIFAKIGDIKGESLDAKHKDEVEVLSWSWGVQQSGTMAHGGGGGDGGRGGREPGVLHVQVLPPAALPARRAHRFAAAGLEAAVGEGQVRGRRMTNDEARMASQ